MLYNWAYTESDNGFALEADAQSLVGSTPTAPMGDWLIGKSNRLKSGDLASEEVRFLYPSLKKRGEN